MARLNTQNRRYYLQYLEMRAGCGMRVYADKAWLAVESVCGEDIVWSGDGGDGPFHCALDRHITSTCTDSSWLVAVGTGRLGIAYDSRTIDREHTRHMNHVT